jgi:hypothetical protein
MEEQARMSTSRGGAGAKIVANKTLPKEERRRHMAQMLLKLDKTPTDPAQLELDRLRTSGLAPATIAREMAKIQQEEEAARAAAGLPPKKAKVGLLGRTLGWAAKPVGWVAKPIGWVAKPVLRPVGWLGRKVSGLVPFSKAKAKPIESVKDVTEEVTAEDLKRAFANENMRLAEQTAAGGLNASLSKAIVDNLEVPDVDDPALADAEKGPPKMIAGHELLGDTPVVFQPYNVMTMARVGQPLSDVASQADVFIRYKCRKGECKTCVVNINGKWVSACQAKIPPVPKGQSFDIRVRPVSDASKNKTTATFFSVKSLVDGGLNNALGMVGFVKDGVAGEADFQERMERERLIQEVTAKKAMEAKQKVKLSAEADESDEYFIPGLFALASFMLALTGLNKIRSLYRPGRGIQEPLMHS